MSFDTSSPFVADALDAGGAPLTPETFEEIVEDFRRWTQEHVEQAESLLTEVPRAPLDVAVVVAQFTALRQEVNLQTRNSRSQLEQNASALEQLSRAVQMIREQQQRLREENAAALDGKLRPLVKAFVDARDALALAERNVRKIQESLRMPEPAPAPVPPPPACNATAPSPASPSLWARLWGAARPSARDASGSALDGFREQLLTWSTSQQQVFRELHEQNAALRQAVDSILVGYRMSLERLERMLEDLDVTPIKCVGEAFDAETMEVVDVVRDPGRRTTEVLEEVRPGYRWRDSIFRCAQVRVARP
jgi:molecular chaperone GrpE (heat shock protein)